MTIVTGLLVLLLAVAAGVGLALWQAKRGGCSSGGGGGCGGCGGSGGCHSQANDEEQQPPR